jgi:N-acetylglucosaminyl-diphospho-decaprenol L-rhamnosyltransferase
MDVTVILVNYNTANLLVDAIEAVRRSARGLKLNVVIVDNASRDNSVALMRGLSDCMCIANEQNIGFGRANNQALEFVLGRYALLLNTDAFVSADSLDLTVNYMDANPECGVLGVKLTGRDGALQPSCRYFPTPWNVFLDNTGLARFFPKVKMVDDMRWDHATVRECDWVPGCFYLVRKEVLDTVGLFDPRYFLYFEEVDHCRAVKAAGWSVMFFPHTSVVHLGGESAKSEGALTSTGRQLSALQIESELLYFRKHHGLWGAWGAMALSNLGDAILALKVLLRGKGVNGIGIHWRHALTSWSVFRRTAYGKRATR